MLRKKVTTRRYYFFFAGSCVVLAPSQRWTAVVRATAPAPRRLPSSFPAAPLL